MGEAARRWAQMLGAWAIPEHILAAAPESPWGFPPALFKHDRAGGSDSPSHRRAREVLPANGSVLDVGVGGGAGSIPLHPPAARITGVDEGEHMLAEFAGSAEDRGIAHQEVLGRWPDVAASVAPADLVVCHHVFYNAPDIEAFAEQLTNHARVRVVAEMTAIHPQTGLNELWRRFHGLERPAGPSAEDAREVLREMGLDVAIERWSRPPHPHDDRRALVAFVRRRLCLPAERDEEIDAALGDNPVIGPRDVATLWWDGAA
ncbi:MAG: class I SAM-dependent methyltransferase [Actinomycetota bacterium]